MVVASSAHQDRHNQVTDAKEQVRKPREIEGSQWVQCVLTWRQPGGVPCVVYADVPNNYFAKLHHNSGPLNHASWFQRFLSESMQRFAESCAHQLHGTQTFKIHAVRELVASNILDQVNRRLDFFPLWFGRVFQRLG